MYEDKICGISCFLCFFFNDTATTEIYTLSLHDALPISFNDDPAHFASTSHHALAIDIRPDRKSTRLNSSHANISYAVFCLKKKIRDNTGQRFKQKKKFEIYQKNMSDL